MKCWGVCSVLQGVVGVSLIVAGAVLKGPRALCGGLMGGGMIPAVQSVIGSVCDPSHFQENPEATSRMRLKQIAWLTLATTCNALAFVAAFSLPASDHNRAALLLMISSLGTAGIANKETIQAMWHQQPRRRGDVLLASA